MNLLFLTPQLPYPPRQGTAMRNWGLIKHLAARHAITLLSFAEAGQAADTPELRAVCRQVEVVPVPRRTRAARLRTLFGSRAWPDLAHRLYSPEFERALAALMTPQVDIVHVEGLEMAPYLSRLVPQPVSPRAESASLARSAQGGRAILGRGVYRVIYDAHNAEHVIQRRAFATDIRQPARWPAALYSWIQFRRLKVFEAAVCRAAHGVVCASDADAAALRTLTPSLRPAIVPNGIDVEEYIQYAARNQVAARSRPAPATLVFTGKMDYRPNLDAALWFAGAILPRIRAERPDVHFAIVGQKPPPQVTRLNGRDGVVVTGSVEDARWFIVGAEVYVAPLRMGGGTRFKLLEAMALARPVVATAIGAEGFELLSGRECLLADTPTDFAADVLSLLADSARSTALGQAGQAFVRAGYDWSVIIPRLEALYGS